ncbi:MAG: glycosyltransferase [Bacteroidota bacterium]
MDSRIKHITVASYAHPELYPPILSALEGLSGQVGQIKVITRNTLISKWTYPKNVEIAYVNKKAYYGFGIEHISIGKKIKHFFRFVKMIKSSVIRNSSEILIVHDIIPLFTAYLLRRLLKSRNIKLWYHNHDVADQTKSGKYSLMGIAARFEDKAFKEIDLFTLPSKERLKYFPIERLNSSPIVLPNYPLLSFYSEDEIKTVHKDQHVIKLVFQGSIGAGHGLEDIIPLLADNIEGKKLELHLVGKIREPYLKLLNNLANEHGVVDYFKYHGIKSFADLPKYLSQFDVGLAIHKPYNVTYTTGGTASNKIYEYAACGLPVVLFDNNHYRDYLEQFEWTYFTDVSESSLLKVFSKLKNNLDRDSKKARQDFELSFNFELSFKRYLEPVLLNLNTSND